jgi:hypothetical protein
MEQRTKSRVKPNEPVTITALQNDGAVSTGRFVGLSSNDMRIKSDADLEVGSLLKLDVGDNLMMAEVCQCEPDEGEYSAGLLILSWLEKSELKRLLHEAVAGPAPQRIPSDTALLAV